MQSTVKNSFVQQHNNMAYETYEGPKELCYFCGQSFTDATEKEEHILNHFKRKHCYVCDNELISIGDKWYQLHIDINCNGTKIEPDIDYTDIAMPSDPDPLAMAEYIIKSEPIELPASAVHDPDTTLTETFAMENYTVQNSLEVLNKPHKCPFCPATFAFANNRSRHKHKCHKQEIADLKLRQSIEKRGKMSNSIHKKAVGVPDEEKRKCDSQNKPYSCSFCPATFLLNINRIKHHRAYHQTEVAWTMQCDKNSEQQISTDYENAENDQFEKSEIFEHDGYSLENTTLKSSMSVIDTTNAGTIEHEPVEETFDLELDTSAGDLLKPLTVSNKNSEQKCIDLAALSDDLLPEWKRQRYVCPFCPARFTFASNRNRHKTQYHKPEVVESKRLKQQMHKCPFCPVRFSLSSSCSRHKLRFHRREMEESGQLLDARKTRQQPKPHSENMSKSVSVETEPLQVHIIAPTDLTEPSSALDNEDNKSECSKQNDLDDVRSTESLDKPHVCPFCPARFTFASNRSRHKNNCHKEEMAVLKLRKTLKKDKKSPRVIIHVKHNPQPAQESSSKPYNCEYCPAGFETLTNYLNHKYRSHRKVLNELKVRKIIEENDTNDMDVESNECDVSIAEDKIEQILESFAKKVATSISRSRTKYNIEVWRCETCSKSFYCKQNAIKHIRLIHASNDESMVVFDIQEQSTSLWYCCLCYFKSTSQKNVQLHIAGAHQRKEKNLLKPIQDWQDPDQIQLRAGEEVDCDYCRMTFGDTSELNQHKRSQHMKELDDHSIIRCSRCPALFDKSNVHQIHSIQVHGVLDQLYLNKLECIVCGESFKLPKSFVEHLKTHADIDNYVCPIKSCDEHRNTIAEFKLHLRSHTISRENKHKCQKCGRYYGESTIASHQCIVPTYFCDKCGKQLSTLYVFQAHMDMHSGAKRFKCNYCPAKFNSSGGRLRHQRTHTGEKRYKCTVPNCNRAFGQHVDLYRHQFRAHGIFRRKFPCTICKEVFPENSLLRKHLASHD